MEILRKVTLLAFCVFFFAAAFAQDDEEPRPGQIRPGHYIVSFNEPENPPCQDSCRMS
jgi:hypothetical protein